MSEVDYEALDPGIREVVRYLRGLGYDTTDSGDGESKLVDGYDPACVLDVPHVAIAWRLDLSDIISHARHLRDRLDCTFGAGWHVQASYDTKDHAVVLFAYKGELT